MSMYEAWRSAVLTDQRTERISAAAGIIRTHIMPSSPSSSASALPPPPSPPTCGASLLLPQFTVHLDPIPYNDNLGCKEHNATCMRALRTIMNYAGGLIGLHSNVTTAVDHVYGVGPISKLCPSDDDVSRVYPCVSAPLLSLSYRSPCALYVHAGCSGASKEPWSRIGCQMHAGSRIRFPGFEDDPRLAGEWIVGPERSPVQEGNSFWVFRADGTTHGLEKSEIEAVLHRRGTATTHFQCVLDTVPHAGASCCHSKFVYDSCPALEAPWPGSAISMEHMVIFACVGVGSLVAVIAIVWVFIGRRRHYIRCCKRRQPPLAKCDAGTQADNDGGADASQAHELQLAQPQQFPSPCAPSFEISAGPVYVASVPAPAHGSGLPNWDVMYVDDEQEHDKASPSVPESRV